MNERELRVRTSTAALELALSSVMIAAGGILLGVQLDGARRLHGTGYASFSIGVLVALVSSFFAARRGNVPRDGISAWSAIVAFFGVAFAVGGVVVPNGPWLLVEFFVLVWLFARRRAISGLFVTPATALALAVMLCFRLWITLQASRGEFDVMTIDVPIVSSIPISLLAPFQHIFVGSFTPDDLELPASDGLDFAKTMGLWSLGFAQVVAGLWWRAGAAREHEDDRIHAVIQSLPRELARLVESLIPESDWIALDLHGLSQRKLEKRIEQLVRERIGRAREVDETLRSLSLGELGPGNFAAELRGAIEGRSPRKDES